MAELPEIHVLCGQMNEKLVGKVLRDIVVKQDKCLNRPLDDFTEQLIGQTVLSVSNRGKWIDMAFTDNKHLLLNLGMGGDILYHPDQQGAEPDYPCLFTFHDGTSFSCKFWWFGHVELVPAQELPLHKPTCRIACSPFDPAFTLDSFASLIRGKRTRIKNIMLDQSKIGGIGNSYIHDILFLSGVHPLMMASLLPEPKIELLYEHTKAVLSRAREKKGCEHEKDFYGQMGQFRYHDYIVGYHEGKPCPTCGAPIEKIKTGSTSSFICPECQSMAEVLTV